MSIIELEPTDVGTTGADWKPIAHIVDLAKLRDGERPTHGLCGAPLLGIRAEGDYDTCEECERLHEEILSWRRW